MFVADRFLSQYQWQNVLGNMHRAEANISNDKIKSVGVNKCVSVLASSLRKIIYKPILLWQVVNIIYVHSMCMNMYFNGTMVPNWLKF